MTSLFFLCFACECYGPSTRTQVGEHSDCILIRIKLFEEVLFKNKSLCDIIIKTKDTLGKCEMSSSKIISLEQKESFQN